MSMISRQVQKIREMAGFQSIEVCTALLQAADTIEALQAKLSRANMEQSSAFYNNGWVLCEYAKPNENEEVLVSGNGKVKKMRYVDGMFKEDDSFNLNAFCPEGWMPSPAPLTLGCENEDMPCMLKG